MSRITRPLVSAIALARSNYQSRLRETIKIAPKDDFFCIFQKIVVILQREVNNNKIISVHLKYHISFIID